MPTSSHRILGLEQQNTAAYTQLYNIFGPGGSYAAGGANNYDAATNSTVAEYPAA